MEDTVSGVGSSDSEFHAYTIASALLAAWQALLLGLLLILLVLLLGHN